MKPIHADPISHEFRLLRNKIEAAIHAPALIFVTSATDEDGTGFASHGLAESLSRTHQRTVVITSDPTLAPPAPVGSEPQKRRATDINGAPKLRLGVQTGAGFSVVCLSAERINTISRTRVAEMVQELRTANDYVIVDAGNLAKNGLGLLLIGQADVAIVAFRAGRAQSEADRLMMDALEQNESKVLGVVMTDQTSIDTFGARAGAPLLASENVEPAPRRAGVIRHIEGLTRMVRQNL